MKKQIAEMWIPLSATATGLGIVAIGGGVVLARLFEPIALQAVGTSNFAVVLVLSGTVLAAVGGVFLNGMVSRNAYYNLNLSGATHEQYYAKMNTALGFTTGTLLLAVLVGMKMSLAMPQYIGPMLAAQYTGGAVLAIESAISFSIGFGVAAIIMGIGTAVMQEHQHVRHADYEGTTRSTIVLKSAFLGGLATGLISAAATAVGPALTYALGTVATADMIYAEVFAAIAVSSLVLPALMAVLSNGRKMMIEAQAAGSL